MKLIAKEIELYDIMIDPYNPRFIDQSYSDQNVLIKELLKKKYVKELLRSMQIDIKWVNRIVVQEVDKHENSDVLKKEKCKYVIVEGNTRAACLKSNKIKGITCDTKIPVLVAQKEKSETLEEFQKQIRITQGIANVTVVTEWGPLSKAKHLHKLYDNYKNENSRKKPNQLYKLIADELGKTVHEIRQAVIRYSIYIKVAEVSDTIPEDKFGYIEAFEKNKVTRALIGIDSETNEFELNSENDDYTYEIEILEQIPDLIRLAVSQGINTKQFRDIIYSQVSNFKDAEDFNVFIQGLLSDGAEDSFHSLLREESNIHSENYWNRKMEEALETISSFPVIEDWASHFKGKIEMTKNKLEKILKVIK
jgi:hypothetical protein